MISDICVNFLSLGKLDR